MDPDEYITKYGNEKFLEYVNNEKKSFIIYKVNKHKDEIANNDLAYERYLKEVTQDIALMNSQILQNKIIKDVAHLFNVDSNTLNSNVLNQQQYILASLILMIINHMILKYKITQIIYLVIYQNMKVPKEPYLNIL